MARIPRLIPTGEKTVYHVISRTALPGYPLEDVEKDYFVRLIKQKSKLYFTDILGFCIMGNHFHLLVRMLPETRYSNQDIEKRFRQYCRASREFSIGQIPTYREKWESLSEFIKEIKQEFSRFYNKKHHRRGFFWGERFKSLIVQDGYTLVNRLAYIDLNPVRAGIVGRPEEYRWNSIGYHIQNNNQDGFLSLDFGLEGLGAMGDTERLKRYRRYLYEKGGQKQDKEVKIEKRLIEKERKRGFQISGKDRLLYRTRYFTDSGVIGSKEFVAKNFKRFKTAFQCRREKIPSQIKGFEGMYSLKRLSGET